MIIPDILNPFFAGLVGGAEDVAFANRYRLVLCNTDNDHAKGIPHLKALQSYLPSGLIVISSDFSDLVAQAGSYRKAVRRGALTGCRATGKGQRYLQQRRGLVQCNFVFD